MRPNAALGSALALCALVLPSAARAQQMRLLVLDGPGRVSTRTVPSAPDLSPSPPPGTTTATAPAAVPAARAARTQPGFPQALAALARSHQISAAQETSDAAAYSAATSSLTRLSGTRAIELGAVISNLRQIAAAGLLTASRLPALMLTLERNRQWWTTGPLLWADERVSFPDSRLVWQYYPGQGIEIQWLGTFGEANGYYLSGHEQSDLAAVLNEVVPLAAQRAGGIAWEYEFQFDGGSPPWVSSLSQGTAIQSLARASVTLGRPDLMADARSALGIFETPPPQGVRVATTLGAHYLEYSYAPNERILNGFIQSLVGLYDYSTLSQDPTGWALFDAGEAEAHAEVPHYDTGYWSLYDQTSEDDLSYHQLVIQFLQNLCNRLRSGPGQSVGGGALAGAPNLTADAAVYCTTAAHFVAYEHQPPRLTLTAPTGARVRHTAQIRFTLSKISTVTLSVSAGGQTVFSFSGELAHGSHFFDWRPARAGAYTISLAATDLAGNSASTAAHGTVAAH